MRNNFYIDKTDFIREWREAEDEVTLITRPRRFGKTLNVNMLQCFFSVKYTGRRELFEGLKIWQEERYRQLQGTFPVISLSLANVKGTDYVTMRAQICQILTMLYSENRFLLDADILDEREKEFFREVSMRMDEAHACAALQQLSLFLYRYYGKKVIILLDEYDTPMQEAYVNGCWREMVGFIRSLFNSTLMTNPYLERALMTGITRVSKESIFSDLNHLKVVTTTSEKYEACFGFTEEEVFTALDEFGMLDRKQQVREWYDGFSFGQKRDIYNPWSITNFLDTGKMGAYWANTSTNSLAGKVIRERTADVKRSFENLLEGGTLKTEIDEQVVYDQLSGRKDAVWSLLLASGYLKIVSIDQVEETGRTCYELSLTNKEVRVMFEGLIRNWFSNNDDYNDFIRALLQGNVKAMNTFMNRVTAEMFSSFDTGTKPSEKTPERFYHGFVLGLMAELRDRYIVTSNREERKASTARLGRYDVMLEPRRLYQAGGDDAIIIEFKVQDEEEKELSDTVREALRQIEEKDYQRNLTARGIPKNCIRRYGFAFCGKKVLIGG